MPKDVNQGAKGSAGKSKREESHPEKQKEQQKKPANRGFAAMDPEVQKRIAAQGGRAAHVKGTAHRFTSEEARAAGQKGGEARGRGPEQ